MGLTFVRAGTVPYDDAWAWQQQLHARRVAGEIGDTCLLLEHPSVYTAGKRTADDERPAPGVADVVDVDRGGKITWHGPGQLVGYPIVSLDPLVDVVAYVRRLEAALMATCAELGVTAGRVEGRSGVWVGDGAAKVAAIGVRVARGVTMHGFALNCEPDLTAYDVIVPCGIRDAGVTSMSVLTGRRVTVDEVTPIVERHLSAELGGPVEHTTVDDLGLVGARV